jgi:hypothetical protein
MLAGRILVSLMLVGMAWVPSALADVGCPAGTLACCTVGSGTLTCDVAGGCSLGTTKVAHAHAGGSGLGSVEMSCAFSGDVALAAASCTSTDECTATSSNSIGGNMRCTMPTAGGTGYCAVFP